MRRAIFFGPRAVCTMRGLHIGRLACRTMVIGCMMLSIVACSGNERLGSAVTTVNRQFAELQDQILLLNILRRSVGRPVHFTTLSIIRGRSRISAGAGLTIPFGGAASPNYLFNPSIDFEQSPSFEVATQNNQEFYRGFTSPISADALSYYLGLPLPPELTLSLVISTIRIRTPAGERLYRNVPEPGEAFREFQEVLERLIDQGLSTENIELVRNFGPPFEAETPPTLSDLLSVSKEGLLVEEVVSAPSGGQTRTKGGLRRFSLLKAEPLARFCFLAPSTNLFAEAACAASRRRSGDRFRSDDPRLFSNLTGAVAAFDAGEEGRIEIHTRSLSEIFDYLGEVIRVQSGQDASLTIRIEDHREPIFVVRKGPAGDPAAISVSYAGSDYTLSTGRAGGQSGNVLTILTRLLAEAQSVRDLPASNAVTIVGE